MSIITRLSAFLLISMSAVAAYGQQHKSTEAILYGKWKTVKHNYRGLQKFSLRQANQLDKSVLTIEKGRYYFNNIKFVDACPISKWRIQPYDTTISICMPMELIYSRKELARHVLFVEALKKDGDPCYNECLLFLKKDTLITVVGGYTFFRVKTK